MCSAKVHPDFGMPTSNLCPPHPGREKKDNKHTFAQGGGVGSCPPMQGRVGWTFPEREPGLALAPGALVTPHPSLLQRAAKTSSGQDYVYWVDHGEASETDPREQRGAEGGGEGTSIGEETGWWGRQRADEWVEHGHSSIREVVDSVAGPTRGCLLPPSQPLKLSSAHLISSSNSQVLGSQGGEAGPSFAPSLSFACPGLAYFGQQSLDSSHGTIQIQQKQCFSWKAELRWDEGCGQAGPQREGRGWRMGVERDKI